MRIGEHLGDGTGTLDHVAIALRSERTSEPF